MEPDVQAGPGDGAIADATMPVPDAADAAPWSPAIHACGLSPVGNVQTDAATGVLLDCPGSGQVTLANPQIVDQDGGAPQVIAPGTTAMATVLVTNAGAMGLAYPCLALATDNQAVTVGVGGPTLYSLNSGISETYAVDVTFAASIPPGTVVRVAAWAAWWGGTAGDGAVSSCVSAPLVWDVTVN